MEWTIVVPGQPVPQPRVRVSTRGGFARAYVPGKHPIHAYRQAVLLAAPKTLGCNSDAAFFVDIECVFARPKSHLRRNGLASDAPRFPPRCDWDNLGKGICDALTGAIWLDDDQVIDGRCRKRYAEPGEEPHTVIRWGRV
jgi:Holliday junction resolvase RusA-like endonuclease